MPNDNYFHLILNLHEDATDTESIYQKAEDVKAESSSGSGVGGGEPSEDTTTVSSGKDTITATENERNVFYTDVKVFLEGVQVPHTSCAVSYGVGQPPTATIIIPAAAFLRDIPETTKVIVIFKDLVEQDGEYKWRLLFDGELSGITYSIDSNGATMSLSAFHTTAYLTTMQIMTQAGAQYLYNPTPTMIGEFVMQAPLGMSKVKTNIISQVMQRKGYGSMADIVYLIMRNLIEAYKESSAVSRWYWGKLGNDAGGYKILQRIYGVSSGTQSLPLISPDINGSTTSANSNIIYNSDGTIKEVADSGYQMPNGETVEPILIWPVHGEITSQMGTRTPPLPGASVSHKGVDIAVAEGTPVRAAADGTVSFVGYENGYGNWVMITHTDGKATRYAHLAVTYVSNGQQVKQGDKIALSGNTGNSTGPHLHWEYRGGPYDGATVYNPCCYIISGS